MKKIFFIPLIILVVTTSCKKDPEINSTPTTVQPPPTPTPPPVNTAPKANAGFYVSVPLPATSCVLYGWARDAATYVWRKISGPQSYSIDNPKSKEINVSNLEKGKYAFELTVTANGLILQDTVIVDVYDPRTGTNEYVFKNLRWICPMGCSLNIENFNLYVTPDTPVKVYLMSGNANTWIQVPHESLWTDTTQYVYGRSGTHFWVYTNDQEGTLDVKITF